jgi:hypothetical protein
VCICHPNYAGSTNRRTVVQAGPGKKARPYFKNNQYKKGWRTTSVVDHQPSKHKAEFKLPVLKNKKIFKKPYS